MDVASVSHERRQASTVEWIRDACVRFSDRLAVEEAGQSLTFGEFWDRTQRLGARLVELGVQPEDLVGVWAEQGAELLIGIAAIWLAGAAYVPLDPTFPLERLTYIASDSGLSLVVSPERLRDEAERLGLPVISATVDSSEAIALPAFPNVDGSGAAYVIYTSGSTGKPKGVVIEHHSLIDLLDWLIRATEFREGHRIMGTAPAGFDASVPTFVIPLVTGGLFIALPREALSDPFTLAREVRGRRLRALQTSPAMLRMLTEIGWEGDPEVEIWTGGERTAAAAIRHVTPRVRSFWNFYGPTEATVEVIMARLGPDDVDSPIGWPRDNVEYVLLDTDGEPAAAGEAGELYLIGESLARGYLNSPELTADRFVQVDVGGGVTKRAYRTGDLVRQREDGCLIMVGRVDDQIKLRGYRIEPGEIEHQLMGHPKISAASVVAYEPSDSGEMRLAAFYTGAEGVDPQELRDLAKESLPPYMVPTSFTPLENFPMTPSGKIDKKRLIEMAASGHAQPSPEAGVPPSGRPATELESQLLSLFAAALDVDVTSLGVDDDFFDLGGTSLGCVQLFMSIEETLRVELPLSTLVAAPTVRLLSGVIHDQISDSQSALSLDAHPELAWNRVVCDLWSEVLGVDAVTSDDNFFELGGTDNDARRMLGLLRDLSGADLSLGVLHQHPTAREIAGLSVGKATRSSLVPLNSGGSKTPIFCIAGAGSLALVFLALSRQMGPDQPFYGLQAHGLESHGFPDITMDQVAKRYVREIRKVQRRGPYIVAGHSLGGLHALKVAQRLDAEGEEVALLIELDTRLKGRMIGESGAEQTGDDERTQRWRPYRVRPRLSVLLKLPFAGLVRFKGSTQFEVFYWLGMIQGRFARPLKPWGGRAVVYGSSEEESDDLKYRWSKLLVGPWRFISLPGDHTSMIRQGEVGILATSMQREIEQAIGQASRSVD